MVPQREPDVAKIELEEKDKSKSSTPEFALKNHISHIMLVIQELIMVDVNYLLNENLKEFMTEITKIIKVKIDESLTPLIFWKIYFQPMVDTLIEPITQEILLLSESTNANTHEIYMDAESTPLIRKENLKQLELEDPNNYTNSIIKTTDYS